MLCKYTAFLQIAAKCSDQDAPLLWFCLFDELNVVCSLQAIRTGAS
jgi:hypothetical protein